MGKMKEQRMFKPIMMFECKYCRKLFRTNNRHKCRFDPAQKNCLSCKHCMSVREREVVVPEEVDYFGDTCGSRDNEDNTYKEKIFVCESGGDQSLIDLSKKRWLLNCKSYSCMPDYAGKIYLCKKSIMEN